MEADVGQKSKKWIDSKNAIINILCCHFCTHKILCIHFCKQKIWTNEKRPRHFCYFQTYVNNNHMLYIQLKGRFNKWSLATWCQNHVSSEVSHLHAIKNDHVSFYDSKNERIKKFRLQKRYRFNFLTFGPHMLPYRHTTPLKKA